MPKHYRNLSLSRKIGERVVIGDIEDPLGFVEVVGLDGQQRVILSFQFPEGIDTNREELAESKRQNPQ